MNDNFDTLILLVGTNPLPNFVIAEYFMKNNPNLSKIVFIYSEETRYQSGTKKYAENLEKILKNFPNEKKATEDCNERKMNFKYLPLSDISLSESILNDLRKNLKNIESKSIHLNYTGGTKVMGIHVYRFLERLYSSKIKFSYLDTRTFQLVYDDIGRATDDLRNEIKISIHELLELHGYKRKNESDINHEININYKEIKDVILYFRQLIENDKLHDYLENLRKFQDKDNQDYYQKLNKAFPDILQKFHEDYKNIIINESNSNADYKNNEIRKKLIDFLRGEWLEYYVFQILMEKFSEDVERKFSVDIERNVKIKKREWEGGIDFQIDILMIYGYQPIGISCTISREKKICKHKGFEIFLRTRQIGGDEARAILVTFLEKSWVNVIETELQIETGGRENLIVLGRDDLKPDNFIKRVQSFLA